MPNAFRLHTLLLNTVLALAIAAPAAAQAPRTERVSFDRGTSGTVITDRIRGYEIIDYLLGAAAGQRMIVELDTDNSASYFNVMEPGSGGEAMYTGSTEGNRFEGELPVDGDYTIRVYLMRSAARRDESASYSLAVDIVDGGSAASAPSGDFADGLSGGPDFWEVTGVGGGDLLNMRAGPSTSDRVIGQFANGDVLRNLGCRMAAGQKWCEVVLAGADNDPSGWVAGRYLRESSYYPAQDATVSGNTNLPAGNGQPFNATGEVPCSVAVGQPTGRCNFGVIREGGGNSGVWIDMNGRGERYIMFESGKPVYTDAGAALSYDQSGDLYLIDIGDEEHYEIPEVVVYGD